MKRMLLAAFCGALTIACPVRADDSDLTNSTPMLIAACRDIDAHNNWVAASKARNLTFAETTTWWQASRNAAGCLSFLWGYVQGASFYSDFLATPDGIFQPFRVCFPERMSGYELAAVFLGWAEKNPNQWHLQPGTSARAAFQQAWPCKAAEITTK